MKRTLAVIALSLIALTGCSTAEPTTEAAPTSSPTPTAAAAPENLAEAITAAKTDHPEISYAIRAMKHVYIFAEDELEPVMRSSTSTWSDLTLFKTHSDLAALKDDATVQEANLATQAFAALVEYEAVKAGVIEADSVPGT